MTKTYTANAAHTVTILGGTGMMGRGIVRDLISDLSIVALKEIRVCDLSRDSLDRLGQELPDDRITLMQTDVTNAADMAGALAGSDLCINAVPTLLELQMAIFEAALDARVPYMDLGGLGVYTVKQLEWHDRFKAAGLTAILGVGADPGLSNVICRAVADRLDEIDSINLYWAAELVGPENPILVPPYSVSTVLAEYAHPSTQFLDGRHVECPPMSGRECLDLPEPWGRCEFIYSPHSEPLTVPLAEGIREKGIREFTWKLHFPRREHEAWIGLVKAGFGDFDRPVSLGGASVRPLDVLNAVISRNMETHRDRMPDQESHEIHLAIGKGRAGGKPVEARCEVIVSPHASYEEYVDAATSMNASIAAQLFLAADRKPGVYAPESYFETEAYFAECEKRHFTVRTETRVGAA